MKYSIAKFEAQLIANKRNIPVYIAKSSLTEDCCLLSDKNKKPTPHHQIIETVTPCNRAERSSEDMAIEKYIIDKSDLTALLRGEDLAIQPKGNIKGFCVEIADNLTNGDVIKAMFPNALRSDYIENDMVIVYLQDKNESEMVVSEDWWFAPYKAESEDKIPNHTTSLC